MDGARFDQSTRSLAQQPRRQMLQALGAGALAAVFGRPGLAEHAEAKKKRTKNAKKGDVNKFCKAQVGDCIDTLTPACAGSPDPEACVAAVQLCCPELGTCNMSGYFTCLEANAP